jgi:ABC-2 type transport system permease protein
MSEVRSEVALPAVEAATVQSGGIQWGAVSTLWWREIIRFVRQRSRVTGAFAQPLVFWLLIGGGINASFRAPGAAAGGSYMSYFFPGVIAMVLLFTAIFATIAVVEDRQGGFLQGVLVAPVSRTSIVLGQSLGCTTLAVVQGFLFLLMAPAVGFTLTVAGALLGFAVMTLVAFALANLGLIIAWRMESTQGFHAIMNLLLLPMWILSGAFFPASGATVWLRWIMAINPLTYGVTALRKSLYLGSVVPPEFATLPDLWLSLGVTVLFAVGMLAVAVVVVRRSVA